jgi:phosphatidylinositol alpha-mannosyltransferase
VHGFGSAAVRAVFGRVYTKIDTKIAVSESAKKTNELYFPGTYHIVPPGVDINRFTPKGKHMVKMGENTVLFVGRLDPRKGLHRLIRAFALVRQRISDAKLAVVGHGPLYKKCLKMVHRANIAGCVCFMGQCSYEMIPKYFRSATVYTSPAEDRESFGIVLIEAMASGTPVIASDIEGYNKVVDNGRNGLLVNTANPQEYAEAIINVLEDARLRRRFVTEGLHDVIAKYSWDIVAKKIEHFYYA